MNGHVDGASLSSFRSANLPSMHSWLAAALGDIQPPWPFSTDLEPADLVALAEIEGVVALVDARLNGSTGGSSVPMLPAPDAVRGAFREASREAALLSMLLEGETRRMLDLMAQAGLPGLLLKGQALGRWAYPSPHLRASCDIDVLLASREAAQTLADSLCLAGYEQPVPSGELVSYEFLCERRVAGGVRIEVDLHHRLLNSPLFAERFSFNELLAESMALPGLGPHARGLCPTHAFMHACLHRAHYVSVGVEDRLKWLYDVPVLLGKFSHADWQRLQVLCIERGLAGVCLDTVDAATAVFGAMVPVFPEGLLFALKQARALETLDTRRLGDWRYMQYQTFLALPTVGLRLRWLWQRLWPSRDYMVHLYGRPDLGYAGLMGVRVVTAIRRFLGLKVADS